MGINTKSKEAYNPFASLYGRVPVFQLQALPLYIGMKLSADNLPYM